MGEVCWLAAANEREFEPVFTTKFNYCIERAVIVGLCLWGNWALYYWLAVLVFDASFNNLKVFSPILLLQIAASLWFLLRTDLGFTAASYHPCVPAKRYPMITVGISFYALCATLTLLAVLAVFAADYYQWTKSSFSYNLLWVMLLPISFAYFVYSKVAPGDTANPVVMERSRTRTLDCLLFFLVAAALVYLLYGSGFPSPDDAFYGHVMSSTLANPTLPVQGQDLLLNTSAPYSLHPAYRTVGMEVLLALLGEATGQSPIYLYFDVLPAVAALFWTIAAYVFLCAMRVPYPGLAVVASLLVLMFLGGAYSLAGPLVFLWFGKSQLVLIAPPLIFLSVATFMQMQSIRTWFLLFFSVCSAAIWSSTSLFFVPMCLGLASLVFLPSRRARWPVLFATFLALMPIFLLLIYSLLVLGDAPVTTGGRADFVPLLVQGEEYGGLLAKGIVLSILLVLPAIARTIADTQLQTNIYRICMVGIFTVMAPFIIETIAVATGLTFLSFRLPHAYPAVLLSGAIAGIAATHIGSGVSKKNVRLYSYSVLLLALISYGALFGLGSNSHYFGGWRMWAEAIGEKKLLEGQAVTSLIPKNSYVAAGYLDDILPILPEPSTFVSVRHYLNFHKYFISKAEFADREYIQSVLKRRLPRKGDSQEKTIRSIVSKADRLGLTTLVFQVAGRVTKSEAEEMKFVAALTTQLEQVGYKCSTTSSGVTRVCNRRNDP